MKKILYNIVSLLILQAPLTVFASIDNGGGGDNNLNFKLTNPFKGGSNLTDIITAVLKNIIMPLAAVLIVLAIIYAGFKYITAQGKAEAIKEANRGLLYVLIGALILLGAAGISAAIQGTICGPNGLITC